MLPITASFVTCSRSRSGSSRSPSPRETDDEVWVVNHLSDSVSIVDVERR